MTSVTPTAVDKLPLRHLRRGKVREVYEVDAERLLLVASDRVSAFDVVMNERIPHKGAVLTQLTAWWLRQFAATVRHHMLSADAKFEFGRDRDGHVTLIDEVLPPGSSRFWPADRYSPGRSQPSFDKQPLRDYLDAERRAGRWNGEAPPPPLPDEVVHATSMRYLDAYRRITGHTLTTEST